MSETVLEGSKKIAKSLGITRHRLTSWRKDVSCPITMAGVRMSANLEDLRNWAISTGKTSQMKMRLGVDPSMGVANVGAGPKPDPTPHPARLEVDLNDKDEVAALDAFLDCARFNARLEPTGDVEDELKQARKLRSLFSAIIDSWKMSSLANPKHAKAFKDFAAELVKQISTVAKLENQLVKQRMRNGKLLDEESIADLVNGIATIVIGKFEAASKELFDETAKEVMAVCEDTGVENVSLNSDRLINRFDTIFLRFREEIADGAVESVEHCASVQADRCGGEDDEDE